MWGSWFKCLYNIVVSTPLVDVHFRHSCWKDVLPCPAFASYISKILLAELLIWLVSCSSVKIPTCTSDCEEGLSVARGFWLEAKHNKNDLTKTDLDFEEFGDLKLKKQGLTVLHLVESINTGTVIMPSLDYFHTLVNVSIVSLPSCQYVVRCTSQAHSFPWKMIFSVERIYTIFSGEIANLSLVKHGKHSFGSVVTSWKMLGFTLQTLNTM